MAATFPLIQPMLARMDRLSSATTTPASVLELQEGCRLKRHVR
jgi:hypothetical protein